MKVLLVFGSQNDERIFSKLALNLKEKNIPFTLRILSAHRTLKELKEELLKEDYDVIVSGAGLSVALPGVIAAQTVKPVIGLPLKNDYSGLDSLLSIHQMPSGIPVIALGIENYNEVLSFLASMEKLKSNKVILLKRKKNALHERVLLKAIEMLRDLKEDYKLIDLTKKQKYNEQNSVVIELIEFTSKTALTELNKALKQSKINNNIVLFVPIASKTSAVNAIKLLKLSKKGLWVGLNNSKNAVLAAISLFPENHEKLKEFRRKEKEKVLAKNKFYKEKYT